MAKDAANTPTQATKPMLRSAGRSRLSRRASFTNKSLVFENRGYGGPRRYTFIMRRNKTTVLDSKPFRLIVAKSCKGAYSLKRGPLRPLPIDRLAVSRLGSRDSVK
jgi:hypothetical protein